MYLQIITLCVLCILALFLWDYFSHPFWFHQPVEHYWSLPTYQNGIIQPNTIESVNISESVQEKFNEKLIVKTLDLEDNHNLELVGDFLKKH